MADKNTMIREKIIQCLDNIGIEMNKDQNGLLDLLQDSLVFIAFVIELEEAFGIELDETYFEEQYFRTLDDLVAAIYDLV